MKKKYGVLFALLFCYSLAFSSNILISAKEAVKLIGKPNVVFVSGDGEDIFKQII